MLQFVTGYSLPRSLLQLQSPLAFFVTVSGLCCMAVVALVQLFRTDLVTKACELRDQRCGWQHSHSPMSRQ